MNRRASNEGRGGGSSKGSAKGSSKGSGSGKGNAVGRDDATSASVSVVDSTASRDVNSGGSGADAKDADSVGGGI